MTDSHRSDPALSKHKLRTAVFTTVTCATLMFGAILSAAAVEAATSNETTLTADQLAELSTSICQAGEVTPELLQAVISADVTISSEPIRFRQTEIGTTVTIATEDGNWRLLEIQFLQPPGRAAQTNITSYVINPLPESTADEKPDNRLSLADDCNIRSAHQLVYDITGQTPLYITALDANLKPVGEKQWLNPDVPELPKSASDAIMVGLIDSGVNYLLPEIARGLATDAQHNLIGYDFWDMDNRPFDANPARSPFFVQRHGTRTASIVIREAPGVQLVPYRYPRNAMTRMIDLVQHASALGIKVVGMPLGSNTYADWVDFESAAKQHPHILFIVSAGNNGRDIDQSAVYPAAMDLQNMLVVTSADDFIHPAERTNYGRMSVDYMVPAEQIDATDYSGDKIKVSGSSYAVARVLALAARQLQQSPDLSVTDLMSAIQSLSVRAETSRFVSIGYLGDPLASIDLSNLGISIDDREQFNTRQAHQSSYAMPLQLVRLDPRWDYAALNRAIDDANRLYRQCNINLEIDSVVSLTGPEYLMDLSSGNALTLSRALQLSGAMKERRESSQSVHGKQQTTRVYLARDTIMLEQYDANAFGLGNTRNRPWMTNSLWLTFGIDGTDIALAHELFHIASNSGEHTTLGDNLMQARTHSGNTKLTVDQCAAAIQNGIANGVLRKRG